MFEGVDISRAWIETVSGNRFHLLDPRQDEIFIEDIAHALGKMCRFTCHTRRFYSVAEHCLAVSYLVPSKDALWGLLHDASEAYTGDMNRPLKHFTPVGEIFRRIEEVIMGAVAQKFDLPEACPESVHLADNQMLWAEKKQLMTSLPWDFNEIQPNVPDANRMVKCYPETVAKTEFLHRYYELTNQL